ncbi:CsgG/HfaB family protein [uncultured Nevskia sp.]|uniref:CsgG/HfaB family protein n=1 Tax=uncultured Nevskia sp. TaxID=228950 RepID=UPI0025F6B241|nr:CsgG/HfaB family protein [uncultured Nevskia sp.]
MRSSSVLVRSVVAAVALIAAGCTSSATVVDRPSAPTIQQVQSEPANGPRYRIAVTNFEYRASENPDIGSGMADMLSNALFNTNRFIVLERQALNEVTAEQDLSNSSRFKKETAAPIGQLEGAQLIIRGAITSFESSCKGGSLIIVSAKQACVTLNIRIIDAASGRVVNATTVNATSANNSVGIIFTGGALPVGLGAFSKTPLENAIRNAIELAVNHIANTKL